MIVNKSINENAPNISQLWMLAESHQAHVKEGDENNRKNIPIVYPAE